MTLNLDFGGNALVCVSANQVASELGNDLAILNFETGVYHGLDDVGVRVWKLVQTPTSFNQLQETLLAEYDVDRETCDRDLRELLHELIAAGLVEVHHEQAL